MTSEELEQITQVITQTKDHSIVWHLIVVALFSGIGAYFGSYLRKKGETKALKEELAEMTRIVENVKTEQSIILERVREKSSLRLASLDRRLQAHQEAFALWRKLISSANKGSSQAMEASYECQKWWDKNCIYLDAESRTAFRASFIAAANHNDYLSAGDVETVKENWRELKAAADVILKGASLPPLNDEDFKIEDKK